MTLPLAEPEPGPHDVVVLRKPLAIMIYAPSLPQPWIRCASYDAAVARGRELARKDGVDLWGVDEDVTCLIARRPG